MAEIFISYSRSDIAFARRLHKGLTDAGLETWIDWQDIPPSSDWLAEVYEAIEGADAFIFIISEDSINSEICSREIAHASQNNKRLIPIVLADIPPRAVTPALAALNWIFFRECDDFDASVLSLLKAIRTDQAWVKAHTRYQGRALEWERSGEEPGYLLQGQDLAEAESWLAGAAEKDPQPTALQTRYVLAGRQASTQRQQRFLGGAILGVALVVAIAIVAWTQRGKAIAAGQVRATAQAIAVEESDTRATAEAAAVAESHQRATAQAEAETQRQEALWQRDTATSRQLAAQVLTHLRAEELDFALLLGVTASQIEDTLEARASLLQALTFRPHLQRMLHVSGGIIVGYQGLAIGPDGEIVAAANAENAILLWDTETGKQKGEPLEGAEKSISRLEFSPDGEILASGDYNTDLILWDVETGAQIRKIRVGYPTDDPISNPGYVHDIAFSPHGDLVAVTTNYYIIRIWDLEQNRFYQSTADPYGRIFSLAFNPHGTILAVGDKDVSYPYDDLGKVLFWDVVSGDWIGEPLLGQHQGIRRLTFSPDGCTIAAAGNRYLFDFYSADHQGEILFWDVESGAVMPHPLNRLPEKINNIFYAPDGSRLISDYGNSIQVWDVESGAAIGRPFVFETTWSALELGGDGALMTSVREDGVVLLWDLIDRTANIEHPLPDSAGAFALALHPDGDILAAAFCTSTAQDTQICEQSEIRMYSIDTQELVDHPVFIQEGAVTSLAYHPDGILASATSKGEITLWNVSSPGDASILRTFEIEGVNDLAFSPDGSTLAIANVDGITLLDSSAGRQVGSVLAGSASSAVSYSYDGDTLIIGAEDGSVSLWDLISQDVLGQPLTGHNAYVTGVAISPDEMMLSSSAGDGTLIVWDLATRTAIGLPIQADALSLVAVDFTQAGSLVSAGEGGISLWETELAAWQAHACRIANRNLTEEEWATYLGDLPYQKACPGIP